MSLFSAYLDRQQPLPLTEYFSGPAGKSRIFVTIPVYDEPDLLTALRSLAACDPPASEVTVIVVVNSSDHSPPEILENNLATIRSVISWKEDGPAPFFRLRMLHAPSLPKKWAGVGWARKIAMDEAVRMLHLAGEEDGLLAAFDADSTCSPNYLTSIEKAFREHPQFNFVNIHFCHPVDDPALTGSIREGIILYEIYLRYLRNAMEWCGYPHAIHTVGSSFAVRASAYVRQGGMNRRKAGEDFHFLHKIVQLGDYGVITEATVFPAARISHRVPFGTGAALKKWEEGDRELFMAYSVESFRALKELLSDHGFFYTEEETAWESRIRGYDPFVQHYLVQSDTLVRLSELRKNCATEGSFRKRFYHEVNAFWIIQYLNLRELEPGGRGNLVEEACLLLKEINARVGIPSSARELLEIYRKIDRKAPRG